MGGYRDNLYAKSPKETFAGDVIPIVYMDFHNRISAVVSKFTNTQ